MEDYDDFELAEADTEVVEGREDHGECTCQNLSTASHTAPLYKFTKTYFCILSGGLDYDGLFIAML
jgi:hypothetical protein